MPTSIRQIEFLARSIVNRLEDRGLVEFGDAEIGIDVVTRTLEDNRRPTTPSNRKRGCSAKSIGSREAIGGRGRRGHAQAGGSERNFYVMTALLEPSVSEN